MEILEYNARRKKKRLKRITLLAIIALLFVAIIIIAAILIFGGSEGKIRTGSIENTAQYSAAIVRKEKLINVFEADGGYDVADYYLSEGQQVEEGDLVMDVYRLGYSREITLSLWRTRQDIYASQLDVIGEVRNEQLRFLDDGVEQAKHNLATAVLEGRDADVMSAKDELSALLEERADYLKEETQRTETLNSLYQKEDEWANTAADSRLSLRAESAGRISYYYDDFTLSLNADKLDIITSNLVSSAIKKNRTVRWMGSSETVAYRLVDPDTWYCVFLTDSTDALRLAAGEKYPVTIEGYGEFEGVAEECVKSGTKIVNILRIEQPLGSLIDARAVSIKVDYSAMGLRVEKRAVQFEDGSPYVEIMQGGKRTGVYVNVLADNGNEVIVSAKNTENAPLAEGARYWIPKRLNISLKKLLSR